MFKINEKLIDKLLTFLANNHKYIHVFELINELKTLEKVKVDAIIKKEKVA